MGKLKIDVGFSLGRLDLVTKGLVSTQYLGNYQSVFKGRGLEFAGYRPYAEGVDDSALIDWKASRRANSLLVKEFVEERDMNVVFVVDVSKKMLTSSTKKLKAEYIAESVSALAHSMLKAGDAVGTILFSDRIVKYMQPAQGLNQFYSVTDYLSNTNYYGGVSYIDKAIDFAFKNVPQGSLVILFSDFIYPMKDQEILKLSARKFDLIVMMVRDPRDMNLPKGVGQVVVQDPYSGDVLLIDPNKVGKDYERIASSDVLKVRNFVKKAGADFLFMQTDKPFVDYMIKFFRGRANKWR